MTRRADVRLHLLPGATPLKHGARIRVHHGTDDIAARVSVAAVRPPAGAWQPARPGELGITVPPGAEAFARLRLDRPAVLTRGDALVLRTASPPSTIGGAFVLDPEPASGGVRRPSALDRFERLDAAGVPVELWLREAGGRGLDRAALVRRGGLDPRAAGAHADALVARGGAWDAGGRIVDAAFVDRVAAEVRAVLAEFHRASPDEAGMFREALRERVAAALAPGVFDAMLARLAAAGEVAGAERVALASHRPARSVEDGRARDAIDAILLAARLAPPDAASLATATGLALPALERVLQGLVRERKVVRLDGVCFHPQALASLRADVQALRPAGSPDGSTTIDVAAFKERYGLTRKFAIPLLEWLDRERVTRRVGEKRVIL